MNGNSLLLDSNILLYLLNGEETLIPLLEDKQLYLSFITQLELLSFPGISEKEINKIKSFIDKCIIIEMSSTIKEYTIKLRKKHKLKLPDSIIAASSLYINVPLVTADTDFKKISEDVDLVFYQK
ncbi:MAG: PIN domain-containing protein [Psychroflexus sp.]